MKMAKYHKILISLIFAFVLCVTAMVCTMTVQFASALTATPTPSKFFTFSAGVVGEFRDDAFIVNVKDGDSISFNNKLVVNDMAIEMLVPTGMITAVPMAAKHWSGGLVTPVTSTSIVSLPVLTGTTTLP